MSPEGTALAVPLDSREPEVISSSGHSSVSSSSVFTPRKGKWIDLVFACRHDISETRTFKLKI